MLSQINNLPLHDLIGGKRKEVVAGADFGIEDSIDILIEKSDKLNEESIMFHKFGKKIRIFNKEKRVGSGT